MATSTAYKDYQREPRQMTIEDLFNLGMNYADIPLQEGYAKLLVNFDIKNQGSSLVPRGGIKVSDTKIADLTYGSDTYYVHHVGSMLVQNADGQDATVYKYILLSQMQIAHIGTQYNTHYMLANAKLIVDMDGVFKVATIASTYYTQCAPKLLNIHGTVVDVNTGFQHGVYCSIAGNTYLPASDANGANGCFLQLTAQLDASGNLTASFVPLAPKDVSAAQVINSGYNMMKTDPYTFNNTQNATGAIVLGGIIPKTTAGVLKLTSDVGETIRYHLNYTYPAADVGKKYMVQWEVVDTTTGTIAQVLQQVRKSAQYTPGDDIYLDYTVGYKQYTIIVKMYIAADVAAHTYVSDEDDYNNLAPKQVITVSSYGTDNRSKNTANLTAKNYDLSTCVNMCVWQQRMVVWGVKDAASTLFVSQANLPEYVAYPNDVEIFDEDIITCTPYLDYLLVFTTNKLYKLAFATDGVSLYYNTKCVQANLPMTKEDASTIQVVKNMVYFKSKNYYYMIVPNTKAGSGELQLAPVSNPINRLLDTFTTSARDILQSTYNLDKAYELMNDRDTVECRLIDYDNLVSGNVIRNVYKCLVTAYKHPPDTPDYIVEHNYIDIVLNYDTLSRAWTIHLYESNMQRLTPYEQSITYGTKYIQQYDYDMYSGAINIVYFDETSPKDEAPIATGVQRKFNNYQLLDTGYRAHYPQHKKRFREIQFSVCNTQQELLTFYTGFTVDDNVRKDLYEYNVIHNTDETDPNYGLVYVECTLVEPETILGALNTNPNSWVLDFSKFPNITVAKVRYRVSGKGYNGKMKVLSTSTSLYEILNTNWVYRKMNAR